MSDLTDAKRRLLERLQRVDTATAGELAAGLDLTDTAVRQHLESLQATGLVHRIDGVASGRGRPAARWQLAERAAALFADRHADLTVDLLAAVRDTLGDEALEAVLATRAGRQVAQYRRVVGDGSVAVRVSRLAEQRSAEGYEAEIRVEDDDVVLIEHHCPVRAAAGACGELCRSEREVFEQVLGPDVRVEREQHLLSGDQRCAYRITRAS